MIDFLDRMIAQIIHDDVDSTLFVGFSPPDEDWRTKTVPGNANAVNVYLIELRENRRLRSNERDRSVSGSIVSEQLAPRRIDCHYLITTWSPASVTPQVEATLDEHALLYAIASALADNDPFVALDIFASSGVPANMPAALLQAQLPVTLLPVEGFHKWAEFWGTMGRYHQPWKPAIYVIVTLPLVLAPQQIGSIVTNAMFDLRCTDATGSDEYFNEIAGTVWDTQFPPNALSGVWVELLTPTDTRLQLSSTDSAGHFVFTGLPSSAYRLRATSASAGPIIRDIQVPSPSGEYDLQV